MIRLRLLFGLMSVFLLAGVGFQYFRPVTPLAADVPPLGPIAAQTVNLPWPAYGQAAISEETFGPLAANGNQTPVPMASTAKIVTALAVLKQKPLQKGETGPLITITAADVDSYNAYRAQQGSVAKVEIGEQISQYQALQAVLIASANNIADTLVTWAFGSMDDYLKSAELLLAQIGADQTKVDSATGFSSGSVSTAEDLVKLGEALMQNSVAAEIVAQKEAELPVAGKIQNYNSLLGTDGVVGVKTGNTDEAGGCFVWAANRTILGKEMNFVGAVMGAPTRAQAIADSQLVIKTLDQNFHKVKAAKKGQLIGRYTTPWNTSAEVISKDDFTFVAWKGQKINIGASVEKISVPQPDEAQVGKLIVPLGKHVAQQPLVLKDDLASPPWTWRLFR